MKALLHPKVLILWVTLLIAGCASTPTEKNTSSLAARVSAPLDGRSYTVLTVMPFSLGTNVIKAPAAFGENFAGDLVARLRADHPNLFREVRWNVSDRVPDEAVMEGTIKTYRPGSAEARSLLIGLGSSGFEGEVTIRDAADGRELLRADFDKMWAWGGALGGSKTIDNMVAEAAVAITKTVALWKHGKLPSK